MSIQIPNLFISDKSAAKGRALIGIKRRQDPGHAGEFLLTIGVSFNPAADDYPSGSIRLKIDLTDSLKCDVAAKTIEQINSMGKHTPTLFITGRCVVDPNEDSPIPRGCRYWLMIADNSRGDHEETPDVVGFVIFDRSGKRIAYGTGPVKKGNVTVSPSAL